MKSNWNVRGTITFADGVKKVVEAEWKGVDLLKACQNLDLLVERALRRKHAGRIFVQAITGAGKDRRLLSRMAANGCRK